MKKTILFLIIWLLLTIFFVNLKNAVGQEQKNDSEKQSVLIQGAGGVPTSVHVISEWETEMSAHVEKSDCLKCLDNNYILDCKAIGHCLDVVVN